MQLHTLIEGMIEVYLVMHNDVLMCSSCNDSLLRSRQGERLILEQTCSRTVVERNLPERLKIESVIELI